MARDGFEDLPPQRPGPDVPEPPPVPASHPAGRSRVREALRIPVAFYVECVVCVAGLVVVALLFREVMPTYVPALLLFSAAAGFGACVVRLIKRVIAARAKGRPPLEATLVFWLAIAAPVLAGGFFLRHEARKFQPNGERLQEARRILLKAFSAEEDFRRSFGRYTYNVKELGFGPAPGAHYVLGFPAACTAKFGVEGAKSSWDLLDFSFPKPRKIEIEELFKSERAENCPDPKEGFVLYAAGQARDDGPLDVWKIDGSRRLVHERDGSEALPEPVKR